MSKYRICSGCERRLSLTHKNFYLCGDKFYTRCRDCIKKYREKYYNSRIIVKHRFKVCKHCDKKYTNTSKNFFRDKWRIDGLHETCKKCEIKRRKLNYSGTQFKIKIKTCCDCNRKLNISNFDVDRTTKDGYKYRCRKCCIIYTNTEDKRLRTRNRQKCREKDDPTYKLYRRIRTRIYMALRNNYKNTTTKELLGCSIENLKQYLEIKFKLGMSWVNYGVNGWHIDHIIPCDVFDLSDEEQQKKCFNYTNLQPLWARENIIKGHNYYGDTNV